MKIAIIIVRILMGLLFAFASITVLFHLFPQPELTGRTKTFMEGIAATGYLLTLLKVTELCCAIAFLTNRFVALAAVVLFPVSVNIFMYHAFVQPEGLPVAIFVLLGNLFLAYAYRERYRPMLKPR